MGAASSAAGCLKDPEHKWVTSKDGSVPSDAFLAGFDHKYRGVFICSALVNGEQTPGKVVPAHDSAMVPSAGKEHWISEYHVLCGTKKKFRWRKTDGSQLIPPQAVKGGVTKDGEPMYIGRVQVGGADTIGKVLESQRKCFVPYNHCEQPHFKFEILIARQEEGKKSKTATAKSLKNAGVSKRKHSRSRRRCKCSCHNKNKKINLTSKTNIDTLTSFVNSVTLSN